MSTEYWAGLGIGYRIDPAKLPNRFRRHVPEQVVFEDRFDSKTGMKLPEPERVVLSEAQEVWLLDGKEYLQESIEEFLADLATKVGGVYDLWGSDGNPHWSIELPGNLLSHDPNDEDVDPDLIAKHLGLLEQIGQRLRDLGIEVGKPKVFAKLSHS